MSEIPDEIVNAVREIDILIDEYRDQNECGHLSDAHYRRSVSVLTVVKERILHSYRDLERES